MLLNNLEPFSYLLNIFMILGVIAAGISGVMRAIKAKMDITGAVLLSFIAGNGGGTVRDIILRVDVFWTVSQYYIWISIIVGLVTFLVAHFNKNILSNKRINNIILITDAMGLATFSLAGVEKSLNLGLNITIAILMGLCTAIGGGIAADIVSNRIPQVFSRELYISVSLLGCICYLILYSQINPVIASIISVISMIVLRICSVKFNWKLPKI